MAKMEFKFNKKTSTGAGVLGLLLLIVLFQNTSILNFILPSEEKVKKEANELKKLQEELKNEIIESTRLIRRNSEFAARGRSYWLQERDGKPETEAPRRVESAGRLAEIKLSSIGSIRTSKITEGIISMEMSITAEASIEVLSRFLGEIYRLEPCMRWEKCSLAPDNIRTPKNVKLSGNLRFICVSDRNISSMLAGGIK